MNSYQQTYLQIINNDNKRKNSKKLLKESIDARMIIDVMPISQWNSILEDMKKAAADCQTKDIGDMLLMDVELLKRARPDGRDNGIESNYQDEDFQK